MDTPPTDTRGSIREAHLRDYWKVIWEGRWTVAAIFLLVVVASAIWTFLQVPVYRATAVVEIQPKSRALAAGQDVSGMGAGGYGWFAEEKYHNTQVEIMRSRDVAGRVVDRLGLREHEVFVETDDPVEYFRRRIQVDPRRETGLIEISIYGTDPDEITQWVNTVAEVYTRRNLEKAQQNMHDSIDAIENQLEKFKLGLVEAERERVESLQSNALFDQESQHEIVRDKLKTLNAEYTKVIIEKSRFEQTLERIERLRAGRGDLQSLPELAEDDNLKMLLSQRVDLEKELESTKVEVRPGHPRYQQVDSQLQQVEERIDLRITLALGRLQNKLDAAEQLEQYLRGQIEEAEKFSLAVVKASSSYEIVKTDADARKMVIDLINKALNEVTLGAQLMTNNVSVLDSATPPRWAVKPRRKLNLAMGGIFGLFLGVAFVFFLDYLDNTFRTPEDIEKHLGLAVLGVIPKLGEDGLSGRAVKEAYQSLRTSIIFSSKNRKRKTVLITSTGPQEGKSSTVANVGRTLAQAGDRVIIIDCDLRRPTQHLKHEADRENGLTNYLAASSDGSDWKTFTKTVGPASLQILTCGPIPPSPPELLGSDRFRQLLTTLRDHYDWILIDSPPASSLADATLLAQLCDMAIIVIQHNRTDRDLVSKSLQRLRAVNPVIAGAVLNNVDIEKSYHKDYYYAGYYYYSDEEETGTKKKKKKRTEGASPSSKDDQANVG